MDYSIVPAEIADSRSLLDITEARDMVGQIVSWIALVPMLLDSMLGCCWHHGHECTPAEAPTAVVSAVSTEKCSKSASSCCGHQHQEEEESDEPVDSDSHDSNHPCDGPKCDPQGRVSITFQHVDLEDCAGVPQIVFVAAPDLTYGTQTAWYSMTDGSPPHSVRERCALTQVWLI